MKFSKIVQTKIYSCWTSTIGRQFKIISELPFSLSMKINHTKSGAEWLPTWIIMRQTMPTALYTWMKIDWKLVKNISNDVKVPRRIKTSFSLHANTSVVRDHLSEDRGSPATNLDSTIVGLLLLRLISFQIILRFERCEWRAKDINHMVSHQLVPLVEIFQKS